MKVRMSYCGKVALLTLLLAGGLSVSPVAAFRLPDPVSKNLTNNGNGTVTCHDTGLMWEVKGGTDTVNDAAGIYSWDQAGIFIAQLNAMRYAGFSDWRLPTISELGYIADYSIGSPGPTIDTGFFPNCRAGQYWSSTSYAANNQMAWYFCFTDASRKYSGTTDRFHVRAVREEK